MESNALPAVLSGTVASPPAKSNREYERGKARVRRTTHDLLGHWYECHPCLIQCEGGLREDG